MSEDGISMITFLANTKGQDINLIILEDKDGWKFGAFCFEPW
jgi:hypothetical protein